jgi:hypothetical protein
MLPPRCICRRQERAEGLRLGAVCAAREEAAPSANCSAKNLCRFLSRSFFDIAEHNGSAKRWIYAVYRFGQQIPPSLRQQHSSGFGLRSTNHSGLLVIRCATATTLCLLRTTNSLKASASPCFAAATSACSLFFSVQNDFMDVTSIGPADAKVRETT